LLLPCCGSSCSVHPTAVYVHTRKKSTFQYQPFSSNITKRKQGIDALSTKLQDTLAYTAGKNKMIWFRPSVGETFPCTSVQHGATETSSTYLNAFVCSAVVVRVCQCKISDKYGCSVITALACLSMCSSLPLHGWGGQTYYYYYYFVFLAARQMC